MSLIKGPDLSIPTLTTDPNVVPVPVRKKLSGRSIIMVCWEPETSASLNAPQSATFDPNAISAHIKLLTSFMISSSVSIIATSNAAPAAFAISGRFSSRTDFNLMLETITGRGSWLETPIRQSFDKLNEDPNGERASYLREMIEEIQDEVYWKRIDDQALEEEMNFAQKISIEMVWPYYLSNECKIKPKNKVRFKHIKYNGKLK